MLSRQDIVREIHRVEVITLNVKKEIKTLKNSVRAYKGWTKKYRQQQNELKQQNAILKQDYLAVCQQRDEVEKQLQQLQIKQQHLLESLEEAKYAKESRDKAVSQLEKVIAKIEQYKEACDRANKISYADKIYLIKEAENLLFNEEIPTWDIDIKFDSRSQPQMFTDPAAIGRSLLD
ncbi:MAG TPA: hypothetical protein V6C71_23435 [Coleofasciculaceae cyanobacterium]|jgi:chromosome segregation ATPase